MLDLHNIVEDDIERELEIVLQEMDGAVCNCYKCKSDMAAFALNRVAPSYVRTEKGEFYHKVRTASEQAKREVRDAIIMAIGVVSINPNH